MVQSRPTARPVSGSRRPIAERTHPRPASASMGLPAHKAQMGAVRQGPHPSPCVNPLGDDSFTGVMRRALTVSGLALLLIFAPSAPVWAVQAPLKLCTVLT